MEVCTLLQNKVTPGGKEMAMIKFTNVPRSNVRVLI